jgi:hypothetical protein
MPVSAPMSSGSSYSNLEYGGSALLSRNQDIPRSGYGQSFTTPSSSNSYTTTTTAAAASAYPQLDYAQSLHQQQQQQQQHRKASDLYDASFINQ